MFFLSCWHIAPCAHCYSEFDQTLINTIKYIFFQVLAYSVACSSVSAFSVGIIEAAEAEEAMNKLQTLVENNQQVIIHCLGFASVLFFSCLFHIGYCFIQTVTSRKLY